jgi:drug/metabolite transporter (DMT)-like permease
MADKSPFFSSSAICIALLGAFLFGASMPAAKVLIGQISPQMLAGLLYLGSGTGLLVLHLLAIRSAGIKSLGSLTAEDLPWLIGVVVFGGLMAPVLFMIGLTGTNGSAASLLVNMEAVFTALLAWFAFKENFDRRIFLGMTSIVAGSVLLVAKPDIASHFSLNSLLIVAACFCWGIDNNLTRKISDADPVVVASIKGLVAGATNTAIALCVGATFPPPVNVAAAGLVGFIGYGLSLVLFIFALRHLGTSRTSAYFSTAPFSGTLLSILLLHEHVTGNLLLAASLMGFGVWLHVTESHQHEHVHEEEEHEHMHRHDQHHQHDHSAADPPGEPHVHSHKHERLRHSHKHFPDTHHRHKH